MGRAEELDLFGSALDGKPDSFAVLFVHGPEGIGKSSLLRRFADLARSAGRTLIRVDGRSPGLSPDSFEAEAAAAFDDERPILLIDTFEQCQGLETWLRDNSLPRLPAEAVVVIAGRQAPGLPWQADPGWAQALHAIALRNLPPSDATALLVSRQVPPQLHSALLAFRSALLLTTAVGHRPSFSPPDRLATHLHSLT
ncbi:hypothetical protein ACFXCZ_12795 [Streptomyces sp. NPDC059396]|uniref:hypothetical protein n=1 Tax=Streptomyces sp. NPDC059396 TaxID=3346819 RepID=UPI003684781C